ncbi:MAG TPA: DNA repair protein RadC [Candidatus Saccharimonadales bacterium]|nr:DNA repair protein RadC [Candidatus Saccharimonadales bacterium]
MRRLRRIHQIPKTDRPREKLQQKGPAALSDFELIETLIGNGVSGADVGHIAQGVQRLMQKAPDALSYETLSAIKGLGSAGSAKILAALELAKRHLVRNAEPIRSQQDILGRLSDIRTKQQEYFICLSLDGGQRLIAQRTITTGTLDSVIAHPREVFADPIVDRAASIVVAHNHPSGEAHPSQKDIVLTQQLAAAGLLLGITLRDHLIVTKTDAFSFRQHHLL